MTSARRGTPSLMVSIALAAAALSPAVPAQQAPAQAQAGPEQGGLQEIIVTAQKRAENLQNVPFSVASESQAQIISSGAQNLIDLARNVAGLTIADLGPGQSQIAIRGISSGQVVRDQPGVKPQVGVYLDESPISIALFTPDLELFDLQRVEVLRGPQGTLFGAGSESGTVRYITEQPKLARTEGDLETGISTVKHGNSAGDVKGMMNLPLGDTTALRIVAYNDDLPGFITAYGPQGSIDTDVNSGRKTGARVALLWKPNDAISVTPRIVYQRLHTDGFPRTDVYNILGNPYTTTEPPVPLGDRTQYRQFREGIDDDFKLYDLKLDGDLGFATLTSITTYTDRKLVVLRDASQLTGSVTYQFGGTSADVRTNSPLIDHNAIGEFSQELRLSSNGKGRFDWLVGGFFEHLNRIYGQDLPTPGYDAIVLRLLGPGFSSADFGAPPDTPFFSDLHYNFKQSALFGEGTWHFSDQWALTGGIRGFKFTEDKSLYFAGLFSNHAASLTPVQGSTDSTGVAPRLILSYDPTEDLRLYLQGSRGFRLGGINDPINVPICGAADFATYGGLPVKWKDEWAWNYELGSKMQFLDRRVTLNIAAFYTDIKDLQAGVDAGNCSSRLTVNVPAKSQGIEAELFARPNTNWDFGVSATYVDATLKGSVIEPVNGVPTVVGGLQDGARLPTAPKFQGVASVGYTLPAAVRDMDLFANATGQYVGSSFSQFGDEVAGFGTIRPGSFLAFGNPTISSFTFNPELPAYHIINFRLGLRSSGDQTLEFAAFVNNLTDESAYLSLDRERGTRARVGYLTNQPRTFGVSVFKKF
jgi:iron complex outermembrane recepter protein